MHGPPARPAAAGTARATVQRVDRIWESFGAEDPYYGVLSHPRFHRQAFDDALRREFFASGERHVEDVFAVVRRRLDPAFAPGAVLDFGCGVGRLLLPLARRSARATGVDIAPSMLDEAARNAREAGLTNVELVLSDDTLSRVRGDYDLVHSYIVLQHLGVARGLAMIRRLLALVRPGGLAALHFQYARRESPLRSLAYRARRDVPGFNALMRRVRGQNVADTGHGLMQMNSTPLARVFEALQRGGFGELHVEFSNHGNGRTDLLGAFVFARRVVEPRW